MKAPIWFDVFSLLIGLEEITGLKNNPVIMRHAKEIGVPAWYDNDDKAWCSIEMNMVLKTCGLPMARHQDPRLRDGYDLLRAGTFQTYGEVLTSPIYGCIQVFKRPEGHHVGLYAGENEKAYRVLGANQLDSVSFTWIVKTRCVANVWPAGVSREGFGPVFLGQNTSTTLSTNER